MDTPTGATATGSRGMHIYILSLCCFDLVVLSCVPLLLADLALGQWTIPYALVCKLHLSADCLTKFGAPLLLTALSSFCYFSICQGGRSSTMRSYFDLGSSRTALWVVGFCLLFVFVLGTPLWYFGGINYVVFLRNSTPFRIIPKCSLQASEHVAATFMAYGFVIGFVLPAALFTYFYSAVLYHVHRHARRMRGSRRARYFWKVAKTSMCLVIFYLSCWTPYWSLFLYTHFNGSPGSGDAAMIGQYFIHMLPYINCCGYPILYTLLNRNIKDDYDRVARRNRERREQSRQMQKSTTWGGRSQQLRAAADQREISCGYWSNNTRTDDSPDRSLETMIRGKSPTTPLCGIEAEEDFGSTNGAARSD